MKPKIFLDPGHGGSDPGAVGNNMRESDIALEVCQLLEKNLVKAGCEVLLSRSSDTFISIDKRWQMANQWAADYFISVHINAAGGTGTETFIAATKPQDRVFAHAVNDHFANEMSLRNRGIKLDSTTRHGSLGVLRRSIMPAILVELAFIDSPSQNPDIFILRNRRHDMALALADGILRFLGTDSSAALTSAIQAPVAQATETGRFPIQPENIQRMVDLGVISSPDFWYGVDSIQWLNELLAKAGREAVLDSRIDNGVKYLETALKILETAGVMNSPDYWRAQAQDENAKFLRQLIINMANRSLDPLHRIVWAEARGEDQKGQIAVANVVLNRHKSPQFPNGVYNVIKQHGINSKGLFVHQFSPLENGMYAAAKPSALNKQAVANALSGVDYSSGALWFDSAENSWARQNRTHLFDHGGHSFFV